MALRRLCWVGLMAALMSAAFAQEQPAADPYAATVPVAAQTGVDLQRAAAQALRELVVRLSGRSDMADNAALNGAYAGADRYLEQYRYERNTADTTGLVPWLAQLRFNPAAVGQLLRNAGLGGSAESIALRVSGIVSFEDYATLLTYLRKLAVLKGVNPAWVAGDEVMLQLNIQGGVEQLVSQFAIEGQLVPEASADTMLHYRWVRSRG